MSIAISSRIQLVQHFDTASSITIANLSAGILANIKQIYRISDTGAYQAWTKDGGKAFPALEYGKGYLFVSEDNATLPYTVSSDTENFPSDITVSVSPAIVRYVGDQVDLTNTANITNFKQIYKISNGQYSVWNKVGGKAFSTLDDGETYLIVSDDGVTFPYTFSTITTANNIHFLQSRSVRKINSKTGTLEDSVFLSTNTYSAIYTDSVTGKTYVGDSQGLIIINNGSFKVIRRVNLLQYGLLNPTTIFTQSGKIYVGSIQSNIICELDETTYDVVAYNVNDRVGEELDTINGVSSFVLASNQIYVCPANKNYTVLLEDIKTIVPDNTLPDFTSENSTDEHLYLGLSDNLKYVATVEPPAPESAIATNNIILSVHEISSGTLMGVGDPLILEGKFNIGFGAIVKISNDGTTVLIAAPEFNTASVNNGAVFVYNYNGSAWSETQSLPSSINYEKFPQDISLSTDGSCLVASSSLHGVNNAVEENHGIVRIYKNTSSNSVRSYTLSNTIVGANDDSALGRNISLSGSGVVLAVSNKSPSSINIYKLDNSTPSSPVWTLHHTISPPSSYTVNKFDLNYNGNSIAVSYSGDYSPIYVYEDDGSSWVRNKPVISSSSVSYHAGGSVSIKDDGNKICTISQVNGKKYTTTYTYDSLDDDWAAVYSDEYFSSHVYNTIFTNAEVDSFAHAYKKRIVFVSSGNTGSSSSFSLAGFIVNNSGAPTTHRIIEPKTYIKWEKEQ